MSNSTLTVRVPDSLKNGLDKKREEHGFTSRSEYIRYVLRNAIEEEQTISDETASRLLESRAQAKRGETYSEAEVAEKLGLEPDFLDSDDVEDDKQRLQHDSNDISDSEKPDIAIIGCGGAGLKLINRLHAIGIHNAQTLVIDTDEEEIRTSQADTTAKLDESELEHFNDLDVESVLAAGESLDDAIQSILGPVDHVFILTGIGGQTGTYIAPYIADFASDDAIVTTVSTLPFSNVEPAKLKRARRALPVFEEVTDTLLLLDGSHVVGSDSWKPPGPTFKQMNHQIASLVADLSDHISEFQGADGAINLEELLDDGGLAFMIDSTFAESDIPDTIQSNYTPTTVTGEEAEFALLDFHCGSDVDSAICGDITGTLDRHVEKTGWINTRPRAGKGLFDILGILGGVDIDENIQSLLEQPTSDLELEIVESADRPSTESPAGSSSSPQAIAADGGCSLQTQRSKFDIFAELATYLSSDDRRSIASLAARLSK